MAKRKKIPSQVRIIIFVAIIITLFFGAGVIAGNLKPLNSIKIVFPNKHEINIVTTKAKVGEILKENHIELLDDEIVVPSLESEISGEAKIIITKESETSKISVLASKGENITLEELDAAYSPIVSDIIEEEIEIPYETITKDVSNGNSDTTERVVQDGENGIKRVTYKVYYQNDVEILEKRKELSSEIIKEPVNKIVHIQQKITITSRGENRAAMYTSVADLPSLVEGITPIEITMNTSAYCPCIQCCGKDNGITASGAPASEWYTVAAGSSYPMGTVIYIPALADKPNGGWFVVQDRGGAISDTRLDIFFNSHSDALTYGRRYQTCYVYVF